MRKSTMQSLVSYLNGNTIDNLDEIKAELEAELNRNAAKAEANRGLYAMAHDAVIESLRTNGVPMTVREIVEDAGLPDGFTASKVQYGLLHYWADEVEKHTNGKDANTYTLKA